MKFSIVHDMDSACYIIPSENRSLWNVWINADKTGERNREIPPYAQPVNGPISSVVFENPEIREEPPR